MEHNSFIDLVILSNLSKETHNNLKNTNQLSPYKELDEQLLNLIDTAKGNIIRQHFSGNAEVAEKQVASFNLEEFGGEKYELLYYQTKEVFNLMTRQAITKNTSCIDKPTAQITEPELQQPAMSRYTPVYTKSSFSFC